jgi:hypothetical protein
MTETDRPAFLAEFHALAVTFRLKAPQAAIDALGARYFAVLQAVDLDVLHRAAVAWQGTGKHFPKPAEWLAACQAVQAEGTAGVEPTSPRWWDWLQCPGGEYPTCGRTKLHDAHDFVRRRATPHPLHHTEREDIPAYGTHIAPAELAHLPQFNQGKAQKRFAGGQAMTRVSDVAQTARNPGEDDRG